MFRLTAIISLVTIALFPASAAAQGRGHRGGPPAVRTGPPPVVRNGPAFIARPAAPAVRNPNFLRVRPQRAIVVPQPYGIYSPFYWPSPVYASSVYAAPVYSSLSEPQQINQNQFQLEYEVRRLTEEVGRLREEQTLRYSPPPPSPPAVEAPAIPTVLVFRDGHRVEILNYAIVGQTLWVLDEKTSNKISISDLDLETTRRENRSRGVRFPLP